MLVEDEDDGFRDKVDGVSLCKVENRGALVGIEIQRIGIIRAYL